MSNRQHGWIIVVLTTTIGVLLIALGAQQNQPVIAVTGSWILGMANATFVVGVLTSKWWNKP